MATRFFSRALRTAAALCLVAAASRRARAQDAGELFGRPVVSVSYASDGEIEKSDVERMVTIRPGRPLAEADTAETIRNLFASQLFADVRVEAEPEGDGVAVRLVLLRAYIVYAVHFSGHRGISREELRRVVPFSPGSLYSESDVAEGTTAIRRRLVAEGFPGVTVAPQSAFDRRRFRVEVTYRIESGTRARVAPAIFNGELAPFSEEDFRRRQKLRPGDRFRETRALADATRLREFLHDEGRLKGQVELIAAEPAGEGRIAPVFRVIVGPQVSFEAQGIDPKRLQREVHARLEGQVFDEDLILQYVDEKRAELQRKGYYRAKVTYALDQTPDRTKVSVTVEPGRREAVERIELQGNASVADKTLRRLIVTAPRGVPLLRPGRLTDADLRADVDGLLGWYQSHGWIRARVGPAEVRDGSKPGLLVVRIPIAEGPRTFIARREIAGDAQAVTAELEAALAVKPGQPFDAGRLRQDAFTLQTQLRDRGWLEASVRDESQVSADGTQADVTYRVVEGPRSFFGKTVVRGNAATRTDRVRRLADWREGAPFSEEKILEVQRRLSRTGTFRRVEVRPDPSRPGGGERNVQIELQEARPLSLLYGFGYQFVPDAAENRNDPFVVGGITTHNLFGGMRSAGIEGQIALSGRYRIQASFRDPFLISNDYSFISALFAARETIQDVDLERFGFVNEISHVFGKYLRTSLRLEYQRIRTTNPEALSSGEISEFPRADQPIEEATVGPAFFYDRRDDPIDPHRGYYLSLAGKFAFPVLGAEARYTKFATQGTVFQPLGRAVFVASARFGGIFPYGPADIQVPIAERFFVGGRSTGRAFDTDLLGVPGGTLETLADATVDYTTQARRHTGEGVGNCANTFPSLTDFDCRGGPRIIGGNGFVTLSAEVRVPIAGNFGGVVFYDASQTWKSFSEINLRFEGADGLRQSAGAGLFYLLPIGPLRAEYAWKLTRRTIPFAVVDVTDPANPIDLGIRSQVRESPGQFFVSIGFPF